MVKLTDKQAIFCQEYMVDLNATQAAIRAGYSEDSAQQTGSENLSKPVIKKKISDLMELRKKRTEITSDRVLVELSKIGFADVRKMFSNTGQLLLPSEIDDDTAAALQSIEVVSNGIGDAMEYTHKIKLNDKKGALELIGKHLKLFTDKTELSGPDGRPMEVKTFTEMYGKPES